MGIYESITVERLKDYAEVLNELKELIRKKSLIKRRIGLLSSIAFAACKVTDGNSRKTSQQERYAMSVEAINGEINKYRAWILPEQEIIKSQISRIKKMKYRQVLYMRYIYRLKWSKITFEFFNLEEDFEEEKNGKYRDKIFDWHSQALKELEKISSLPYVPAENKQLHFEIKKGNEDERISKSVTGI